MDARRSSTLSPRKLIDKTRNRLQPLPALQDSVDEENRVHIDYKANPWWKTRYLCWEVRGLIAEEYKVLGPKIRDELRKSCRESSLEVFVWPYMVGKAPKSARPVLIIASEDEPSREEAKVAIERSDILQNHRYFKLWPLRYLPTGPINPVAMDGQAPAQPLRSFEVFYNPTKPISPVGMSIYMRDGGGLLRLATANAVYAGTEYGYITAAHAFSDAGVAAIPRAESGTTFEWPFDTDSESESDGSDSVGLEASSMYSGTSPEAIGTDSASGSTSRSIGSSITRDDKPQDDVPDLAEKISDAQSSTVVASKAPPIVAELELFGLATMSSDEFDVAVIVVTNSLVRGVLERLANPERVMQESVRISEIRRANVTAMTCHGLVQGSILDLPLYMRLARSSLVQTLYMFKHDEQVTKGDCGSLVVDRDTKEVYGHVVAGSLRRGTALMMPAKPVFDTIESQGHWKLLTLDTGDASLTEVVSHTGSNFKNDNAQTTNSTIPSSNEEWQDLVMWDGDYITGPSMDWDFMRSEPMEIISRTEDDRIAHDQGVSPIFTSGRHLIPQSMISISSSAMESLSSRGSVAWSLNSPSFGMTAPSSLGDIDELDQFEHLIIEDDIHKASPRLENPALTKGKNIDRSARREQTPQDFGWVSYSMNNNGRLQPDLQPASEGRTPRGRKKGLTPSQRSNAALMRIVGACSNCIKRKEKCDPGTPCRSCLNHYKRELVHQPCRDRMLSKLSDAFLSKDLDWHPRPVPLESYIGLDDMNLYSTNVYYIPIYIGFGRSIRFAVHGLEDSRFNIVHDHLVYEWPPSSPSEPRKHTHLVLPAVLTPGAIETLQNVLDEHLKSLVGNDFRQFPLYVSPLRVLREIYVFYRCLASYSANSRLIFMALKLLVLVHIGGDITIPEPITDAALELLVRTTMGTSDYGQITPCFIRAQIGSALGLLGAQLMKEVLSSLELLLLGRDCDDWPTVLATLLVILMTVESVQYHSAKRPYHGSTNSLSPKEPYHRLESIDEEAVRVLMSFYMACFGGCHTRLHMGNDSEPAHGSTLSPGDIFISSIQGSIRRDQEGMNYVGKKLQDQKWDGEDMSFFFDRLIARLLTAKAS